MKTRFTVQVQDHGESTEEQPGVRIEVKGSLLDLMAGAVPAEVNRPGDLFLETINPALV